MSFCLPNNVLLYSFKNSRFLVKGPGFSSDVFEFEDELSHQDFLVISTSFIWGLVISPLFFLIFCSLLMCEISSGYWTEIDDNNFVINNMTLLNR